MIEKILKNASKILWKINGGYDPEKFWDEWANRFMKDKWQVILHPQHEWLIERVQQINPKSILEIGCGFGRNINFLIDRQVNPRIITGCDISSQMLSKGRKYVSNKNVTFVKSDVINMPFKSNQFDVLISHGVFMHIPPEKVVESICEAVRVSKKIILIEQNYGGNNYTFVHNYKKLLSMHGKIVQYKRSKKLGLDLVYFLKHD